MCWLAKATFTRPEFYCDRSSFYNRGNVLMQNGF